MQDSPIKTAPRAAEIIPRSGHNISRSGISEQALKVLYRLKDQGYQAFLVGGGVRDLLLGREPKDFDVVTDARPEQVRRVFRNSRLIGRRFRLAHVHFGREYIEVATFRAAHEPGSEEADEDRVVRDDGRILRDNVYGSIDQDVWRRDFTVNAMYYNIADYSVWDYAGGMQDVRAGLLRLIGEPRVRYREDPVRLLRAVRFAAKLGFRIEPGTESPIAELGPLLGEVSPARLFEEVLKLFLTGHAAQSFELLNHYDLLRYLLPDTEAVLHEPDASGFRSMLVAALENTDRRVAEGLPVTPFFLFAVLLWEPIRRRAETLAAEGSSPLQALSLAAQEVAGAQQNAVSVPRRFVTPMREIITMQDRFRHRRGKRPLRLVTHPRFRAAYDFLLLRVAAGEEDAELAEWWTAFQDLDSAAQKQRAMAGPAGKGPGARRRRRRGRRKAPAGG